MTVVVLQTGHWPRTTGATGAPGEQQYARAVNLRAAQLLARLDGCEVRIIGADEPADRYRGDLFIATHYDGGAPAARGPSVGYRSSQGGRLATAWKDAYRRLAGGNVAPFRQDNYTLALAGYYGHRIASSVGNPVACITEGGFGTHAVEGPWLRSSAGIEANAQAIYEAVRIVAGLHPRPTRPPVRPPSGDDEMTPQQEAKLDRALALLEARDYADDTARIRRSIRSLAVALKRAKVIDVHVQHEGKDDSSVST